MNEIEEFFDRLANEWDSHEKNKTAEIKTLLDKLNINKNSKILDIACGTGIISQLLVGLSDGEVTGIDLSLNMIEIAKEKYRNSNSIKFIHEDFLKFETCEKFDFAIIYNAYPHFLDPKALRDKLFECLKENGRFAIVHSLSKERLNRHHEKMALNVSRILKPAEIESEYFKDSFNIDITEDTDSSYIISGTKYVK